EMRQLRARPLTPREKNLPKRSRNNPIMRLLFVHLVWLMPYSGIKRMRFAKANVPLSCRRLAKMPSRAQCWADTWPLFKHGSVKKIVWSNNSLRQRTCRAATSATAICACIHFGIGYVAIRVLKLSSLHSHQRNNSRLPRCALATSGSNQAENLHRLLRTQGGYRGLSLTPSQITDTGELMSNIRPSNTIRLLAAMLVIVAVIVLSTLATHAPAQTQSRLTLKNIRTDKVTTFYADQRTNGAWFVEAVLPTGHYADN